MEAIFAPSDQQSISSSHKKQIKNPSKKHASNSSTRGFISRSIENLAPSNNNNNIHGGGCFFFAPPHALSFSYPPPPYNFQRQVQQQPPLLPLPTSTIRSHNSPTRFLSCPPTTTRKTNRTKDHSLTPKKSKQPITRKEESKQAPAKSLIMASTVPFGPDPNDLPKDVSKVVSSSPPSSSFIIKGTDVSVGLHANALGVKDLEMFTGSVFTLSPPPSSLPLPKFSIRPKLSCTTEAAAAGIDAGATDNLRRLLRLR